MRRIIVILCMMPLLFTACASEQTVMQEDVPDLETDFQMQYYDVTMETHPIVEVGDGYYMIVGNYIYYVDKETMEYTPLCNKANCLHQKETDQTKVTGCNAMVRTDPGSRTVLNYYKNCLYISGMEIMATEYGISETKYVMDKIPLDGGNREIVHEFENPVDMAITHRGYIYYTSKASGDKFPGVYRIPIAGGKEELLYETKSKSSELTYLKVIDNALIIREFGENESAQRYHLKTGKLEEILLGKETKVGRVDAVNGRIYYTIDSEGDWYMESTKLDGSDRRKETIKFHNQDEDYYYIDNNTNGMQDVYEWGTNNKITEFSKGGMDCFYTGKENAFWYFYNDRGGITVYYIDREDIPKGDSAVKILMDFSKEETRPGIVIEAK